MITTEKKYNYFYYGKPISKAQFLENVPANWEDEINEYGEYSYRGYRAIELEKEEK